ncbi:O-methyltransferase [Streptomyces griseoruber]|uniref:O-methyltransferase n=1 Tax=Streptomyces griseoruber TaxID=1943 RepID=UPI0037ACDA9C
MVGARRVLEFGVLAGHGTVWPARALGGAGDFFRDRGAQRRYRPGQSGEGRGRSVGRCRRGARGGVGVAVRRGGGEQPYDFVFIDADKPGNPEYLKASLALTRVGSVIIIDNVVRDGAVVGAGSADEWVRACGRARRHRSGRAAGGDRVADGGGEGVRRVG